MPIALCAGQVLSQFCPRVKLSNPLPLCFCSKDCPKHEIVLGSDTPRPILINTIAFQLPTGLQIWRTNVTQGKAYSKELSLSLAEDSQHLAIHQFEQSLIWLFIVLPVKASNWWERYSIFWLHIWRYDWASQHHNQILNQTHILVSLIPCHYWLMGTCYLKQSTFKLNHHLYHLIWQVIRF